MPICRECGVQIEGHVAACPLCLTLVGASTRQSGSIDDQDHPMAPDSAGSQSALFGAPEPACHSAPKEPVPSTFNRNTNYTKADKLNIAHKNDRTKKQNNVGEENAIEVRKVVISNNPDGQLPVAEAAPGNPLYNGGRWFTHEVIWTQAGFDAYGIVSVLMSYMDVMIHYDLGHLEIMPGSPAWPGVPGVPPDYFQCPMLPVK